MDQELRWIIGTAPSARRDNCSPRSNDQSQGRELVKKISFMLKPISSLPTSEARSAYLRYTGKTLAAARCTPDAASLGLGPKKIGLMVRPNLTRYQQAKEKRKGGRPKNNSLHAATSFQQARATGEGCRK